MTDAELMKKLQEDHGFNPWLDKIDEYRNNLENGTRSFVLQKSKTDDYESKIDAMEGENDRLHLRLDIPPQPFIGTPTAGVWFLLKNPGFSEIDLHDCWGDQVEGTRMLADDFAREALSQRQKLILAQYGFTQERGKEFYLLDKSFNTSSKSGNGGFGWYSRYLFPKNGLLRKTCASEEAEDRLAFCSRNIFVLDYHPYHSENFCEEHADLLKEDYWDKLVEHGLSNNKLFVFWGSKILSKVKAKFKKLYDKAVEAGRIYVLKGASAYFSSGCLFKLVDKDGEFLNSYLNVDI